jgi:hypothetical protein
MNTIKHYGIPGIGGSLGKCAICGENFLTEILLGKSVKSFQVSSIEQKLYAHNKCMEEADKIKEPNGKYDIRKLPDGPLKSAF